MNRGNGSIIVSLVVVLMVVAVAPIASFAGGLVISGDNVGIGTGTPGYPLDVQSAIGNAISGYTSSASGAGVIGSSTSGIGVAGSSTSGYGVYGYSDTSYAGYFQGSVNVTGNQIVGGSVSATSFSGSGSGLTGLDPAKISAGAANISVLGNAATVTNGIYSTGSYANPAWLTSLHGSKLTTASVTPDKVAFYSNVAIVAPSGGDYDNPSAAMSAYASWCNPPWGPDAENPCLLKIMPGVYNIGTSTVDMQAHIDIEGSGENVTVIKGNIDSSTSGVVNGAHAAELRFLTVKHTGGGNFAMAIYNTGGGSPILTNITAAASGSVTTMGIYNKTVATTMTNVTATASGGSSLNTGIRNDSGTSRMINVTATASGGTDSRGVYNYDTGTIMTNVTATATEGSITNFGVYNTSAGPTMINVAALAAGVTSWNAGVSNQSAIPTMTNVTADAVGGGSNTGVYNDSSSLTMTNVTATAFGSDFDWGVYNSSSGTVKINHSVLRGSANTIYNEAGVTAYVGNTQLDGGAVYNGGGGGTLTCAGVYDENYTFYASTCP